MRTSRLLAFGCLVLGLVGGAIAVRPVVAQESTVGECAATGATPPALATPAGRALKIVASTSWAAAFARAAGATDVVTIAPANVQHPPDYDPKPSDLAAVADADYVLLGGFEGFADRMREAVGGSPDKLVTVELDNTPTTVRAEVTRLGELFGTGEAARVFLSQFDAETACLADAIDAAVGDAKPPVVAHAFMASWAEFAGLPLVGTYGPAPITPDELATLAAANPTVVLENEHTGGGDPIVEATGARKVALINFPDEDENLLDVFRINSERLVAALGS